MGDEVKNKHVYLCIQCGYSADALIRKYSKSTLTLQSCENCKQIIDKYIEYDSITVFIDILLLKISAYRHFIFNTENKAYLKRTLILSLFIYSYVEWVYEKHRSYQSILNTEPIFYELEWGYYQMCIQQFLNAMVFTAMFLFNAFLVSKTSVKIPTYFSYRRILDGVAISYCWNLVVIPSLVWNHYDTYNILSQIALLISSIHTFRVCVDPSYFLSISSTLCCFAMRQSTSHFLRQHLIDS